MISINRMECPDVLKEGGSTSTTRYRNEKVVERLHEMQCKKCCYCECEISDEGHGKAVEHFHPKSVFTGKTHDWNNLLLCCAQCNGKKSDLFPVVLSEVDKHDAVVYLKTPQEGTPMIIDPCSVNPECNLTFDVNIRSDLCGLIKSKSPLGKETITVVGLDSVFHTGQHYSFLLNLFADYIILLKAKRIGEGNTVERYETMFQMFVSSNHKYAAVARAFVSDMEIDKKFNVPLPPEAA